MAGAFRYGGPDPISLAGYVQQQGQMGKQAGEDSRLARLVSGAMADPSARKSNLAEIASFRPDAAFAAQGQFDQQDDRKYAELGKRAAVLAGAPEAMRGQVWAQLRPELEQTFGMQGLPAEVTPEIIQTAQQLAQVYGGANGGAVSARAAGFEQLTRGMTPDQIAEARRVELGLAPRAVAPGYSVQEYTLPDGSVGWRQIPTRGMAPGQSFEVGGPGAPAPAPAADPQNVQADLMVLSRLFGVQPSSLTRTPEKNADVGGVPASQHIDGTAGDFPVPEAQKPQFIAMARQLGYEAIDEGDHVHLELPSRGRPQAAPQGVGQTDEDRARAAAFETAAQETAKRQIGLDFAGREADAAAEAGRKKKEAELLAERNATADKKAGQAQETLSTLEDAISLLPSATGSRLGAARDAVLAVGGISTEGAQASAQLRLLAAKLIANVPRFEGPQSNIDVQFYREAAGDLANENLPVDTRLAAAQKMKEIAQRYAQGGSQSQQPAPQPPADDEEALIGKYL
jgi:hypothetical protein